MNSNLVPTVIVNKNGVTTTVHKKPQLDPTSKGGVPAPTITPIASPETNRDELITEICDRVENQLKRTSADDKIAGELSECLPDYPDDALIALHGYIMSDLDDSGANDVRHQLFRMITHEMISRTHATPEAVHEYLTFLPALKKVKVEMGAALGMVRGVHQYKQLPTMERYTNADSGTKRKVGAIITVTSSLLNEFYSRDMDQVAIDWSPNSTGIGKTYTPMDFDLPLEYEDEPLIIGEELIDLIFEKPEEAQEIAQIITSGHVMHGEVIRERLTSSAQSLREGII